MGVLTINPEVQSSWARQSSFNLQVKYCIESAISIPLTTKGDILTRDASTNIRLPVGTDDYVLTADSTQPSGLKWSSVSTPILTTKGDFLTRNATEEVRLPVGANGQIITADSTQASGVKWENRNPLTTKGDLLTRNTTDDIRFPIGVNGTFLKADSTQASGMSWSNIISTDVGYTLSTPANWSIPNPTDVYGALEQLSERVTNLDGAINLKPEFDVSAGISSTTLLALQDKINYTTTQIFPPGNYKINYFFERTTNGTGKTGDIQIDIDGVVLYDSNFNPQIADTYETDTGFFYVTLTGTTTRNLRIRFAAVTPSTTAYIKNAKIDIQPFGGI